MYGAELKLNLIVLKSKDIDGTRSFFELLGLQFNEEKHGDGPLHYSSVIHDVVLEIYQGKSANENLTIGFCVNDLNDIKNRLPGFGADVITEPSPDKPYLIIRDIDGRTIILTQHTE
jgi:lactoylglutathione lyase